MYQDEWFYKFIVLNKDPSTLRAEKILTQEKSRYLDKVTA